MQANTGCTPYLRERSIHNLSLISFYKHTVCSSNLYEFSRRGTPFRSIFPHRVRRPRLSRGRPRPVHYCCSLLCCFVSRSGCRKGPVLFCAGPVRRLHVSIQTLAQCPARTERTTRRREQGAPERGDAPGEVAREAQGGSQEQHNFAGAPSS